MRRHTRAAVSRFHVRQCGSEESTDAAHFPARRARRFELAAISRREAHSRLTAFLFRGRDPPFSDEIGVSQCRPQHFSTRHDADIMLRASQMILFFHYYSHISGKCQRSLHLLKQHISRAGTSDMLKLRGLHARHRQMRYCTGRLLPLTITKLLINFHHTDHDARMTLSMLLLGRPTFSSARPIDSRSSP